MTVRVRVDRGDSERHRRSTMGITNSRGVSLGTRGRAGAQRVQRLVWTPVHALGAAARVTQPLSAST